MRQANVPDVAGPVRRLYLQAFLVRAAVGVLVYALTEYYFDADAGESLLEDARGYERIGYRVAVDWLSGRSSELNDVMERERFGWLMVAAIAVFYYLLQGFRAVPLLLVFYSAITALVPVYAYRIAGQLGASEATARKAGLLVAFSPAFVFWSGTLYKEGLILLCLSLIASYTLELQSQWKAKALVVTAVSVLALSGLRLYLAVVVGLAVCSGLVVGRANPLRKKDATAGTAPLLRIALVAVMVFALTTVFALNQHRELTLFETRDGILVELDQHRRNLAIEAHSGYVIEADITTPEGATEVLGVGLFYFLTAPGPWQIGRLRQNLVIPETTFWMMLYPLIIIGILRARRANWQGTMFLVALTAGMCVVYAFLSGNIGVAYRMRTQVWLLWAPFAAWGWEVWRQRRRDAREAARQVREARLAARRRRLFSVASARTDVRDRRLV